MKRDKVPAAVSIPVLIMVTILYKTVLVGIGIAVLIIRPAGVMQYLEPILFWCWLGIGLNLFFIV